MIEIIILSLSVMIFWGVGDFLIHKSSRRFGVWEVLFLICGFSTIVLFPFVLGSISSIKSENILGISLLSILVLFTSLFVFLALKTGKLSVIDSLFAFEVPLTAMLAFFILGEYLSTLEMILASFVVVGLLLVSFKKISKKELFEKGTFIALVAALFMGFQNFYVGVTARTIDPLLVIWITHLFAFIVALIYLGYNGRIKQTLKIFSINKKLALSLAFVDNAAWICYAYAASIAPIAVVVAISESYIAIAVLLGVIINKERLNLHQTIGIILAISAAVMLSYMIP